MRLVRRSALALVGTVAVWYSPLLGGCVSSPAVPVGSGEDASLPPEDSGFIVPGNDAAAPPKDASQTDSTVSSADAGAEDSSTPETSVPDTSPETSRVRFAWFVGGAPLTADGGAATPAALYDICVAPHGTGLWQGPVLGKASFPGGLQPFDVTSYFTVLAGQYDARVVAAGSTTCDLPDAGAGEDAAADGAFDGGVLAPLGRDFTSLPAIPPGGALSVVFVDPGPSSTTVVDAFAFADDTTTSPGGAKVRFLNVSESDILVPNVLDAGDDAAGVDAGTSLIGADFGIGGGVVFSRLFQNVTSQAGEAPTANGYVNTAPLGGLGMTLLTQSGGSNALSLPTDAITLGPSGIMTAFYATEPGSATGASGASGPTGPVGRSPVLVWCYDGEPSATNALLTHCEHTNPNQSSDSASSFTRFGNFLADTPGSAVDACLKLHTYGVYTTPLFATNGAPAGLPAKSLSGYFALNGGYSYDVRFVAAGSADCSTSLGDSTFMAFSEPGCGGYTSVLLTGYTTIPDDAGVVPPYDAGPPQDAGAEAGPQPVSMGLTSLAKTILAIEDEACVTPAVPAIRVVHLAADDPNPLSMSFVMTTPTVGSWSTVNVPYGGFSTEPGPVDPYGYETMGAGTLTVGLEAFSASYVLGANQTTMFVSHGANGGAEILGCNDYDEDPFSPTAVTYTDCCVLGTVGGNCAAGASGATGPTGGLP